MKRHLCLVILALFIMHSAGAQAPSVVGSETQCTASVAAGHACSNVDMLSRLSMADMQVRYLNDIWGWVDPVQTVSMYSRVLALQWSLLMLLIL